MGDEGIITVAKLHFETIPVPAGRGGPAFVRFGAANEVGAFVADVVHFAAGRMS